MQNSVSTFAYIVLVLLSGPLYFCTSEDYSGDNKINKICNRYGWTCQNINNCPEAEDMRRLDLCGFDKANDFAEIICCPSNTTLSPEERSKIERRSSEMCRYYADTYCYVGVMGGKAAKPKEFPHMALIGYGEDSDKISWECGGSVISERYVLSAAHCTFPSTTTGTANYVRVGDLNTATDSDDAEPQQFKILERINHPEYKSSEGYNDIALYKLDGNITFDVYVKPLCLYDKESLPDDSVLTTGWGRTEFVGPQSTKLLKASITLFEDNECKRLWNSSFHLPRGVDVNSMICAGERDGSRDTCQGDSGGPLISRKYKYRCLPKQVGITSFGRQCGLPDSPGIYTRVAPYLPWIESIVWPEDSHIQYTKFI